MPWKCKDCGGSVHGVKRQSFILDEHGHFDERVYDEKYYECNRCSMLRYNLTEIAEWQEDENALEM